MKIVVNKGEMVRVAKEIANNSDELDRAGNHVHEILEKIYAAWEGADSVKFISLIENKYLIELKKICKCLNEYSEYLEDASKAYNILDDSFCSKKIK